MANKTFLGIAPTVAQVTTIVAVGISDATVYTITIGKSSVSHTTTSTSASALITALLAAAQASTDPEFLELTWASPASTTITATANTPGVAHTISVSGSGLGGSITTANAGPNEWRSVLNWSEGSVPTGADTVFIDNTSVDILYGLDQTGAGGFYGTINIGPNYTGNIGLPEVNAGGYDEYRPTHLTFRTSGATTLNYEGACSRAKFDFGATAGVANMKGSGSRIENAYPAVMLTGAIQYLRCYKGDIGVAVLPGQSSTIGASSGEIYVGYVTGASSDVRLQLGGSGTVTINSGASFNLTGGKTTIYNSNLPGTANISEPATLVLLAGTGANVNNNGKLEWFGGNISGTYTGGPKSIFQRYDGKTAITFAYGILETGAQFYDPNGTITFPTGGLKPRACRLTDVKVDLGLDRAIF